MIFRSAGILIADLPRLPLKTKGFRGLPVQMKTAANSGSFLLFYLFFMNQVRSPSWEMPQGIIPVFNIRSTDS